MAEVEDTVVDTPLREETRRANPLRPVATQSGLMRPLRFLPVQPQNEEDDVNPLAPTVPVRRKDGLNRLTTGHLAMLLLLCFLLLRFR